MIYRVDPHLIMPISPKGHPSYQTRFHFAEGGLIYLEIKM
jgi:hypothetical protein